MSCITVSNVSFGYTEDPVLEAVNLTINQGELVVIVGENGSGKSTLLKLILGELTPQTGDITLLGTPIQKLTRFDEIGYVPQMNIVNKIPFPITCLELVVLGLYDDFGWIKIPRKRHRERALAILTEMGLAAYARIPFNELSGGLQQRVLISRAMINDPSVLVFDEPTAGVDEANKQLFYNLMQYLNDERGISVLLVTHEIASAKENLGLHHIYRLEKGGLQHVSV